MTATSSSPTPTHRPITDGWQKYTVTLTTGHDAPTTPKAKFVLSAQGTGCVWFSLVSLFPPTFQDTPNGLRPDLMKLMGDLHPAFIRLPGGNYLEGDTFATRLDWKKEIGPVEQRPGHMGCWSYRASGRVWDPRISALVQTASCRAGAGGVRGVHAQSRPRQCRDRSGAVRRRGAGGNRIRERSRRQHLGQAPGRRRACPSRSS